MTLLEQRPAQEARGHAGSVLTTRRLVLRPLRPTDAKTVALLANDLRVAAMTSRIPHPYTHADAEAFIAHVLAGGEVTFAITLADGPLIGLCGINRAPNKNPELGYWLGVPHWGQGYATEAAQAVIAYAFADPDIDTLEAGARINNPASRRVLEKCGFAWTGVVLVRVRALRTSVPVDWMRLSRERWVKRHSAAGPRTLDAGFDAALVPDVANA